MLQLYKITLSTNTQRLDCSPSSPPLLPFWYLAACFDAPIHSHDLVQCELTSLWCFAFKLQKSLSGTRTMIHATVRHILAYNPCARTTQVINGQTDGRIVRGVLHELHHRLLDSVHWASQRTGSHRLGSDNQRSLRPRLSVNHIQPATSQG